MSELTLENMKAAVRAKWPKFYVSRPYDDNTYTVVTKQLLGCEVACGGTEDQAISNAFSLLTPKEQALAVECPNLKSKTHFCNDGLIGHSCKM